MKTSIKFLITILAFCFLSTTFVAFADDQNPVAGSGGGAPLLLLLAQDDDNDNRSGDDNNGDSVDDGRGDRAPQNNPTSGRGGSTDTPTSAPDSDPSDGAEPTYIPPAAGNQVAMPPRLAGAGVDPQQFAISAACAVILILSVAVLNHERF